MVPKKGTGQWFEASMRMTDLVEIHYVPVTSSAAKRMVYMTSKIFMPVFFDSPRLGAMMSMASPTGFDYCLAGRNTLSKSCYWLISKRRVKIEKITRCEK